MATCEECGFDYDEHGRNGIVDELASLGPCFAERLRQARPKPGGEEALRRRPAPSVWSALEYTCHVRDTFLSQR